MCGGDACDGGRLYTTRPAWPRQTGARAVVAHYAGGVARRAPDPQDRTETTGRAEPLITRRDLAGWVDGPGGGRAGGRWPGDLLGLPERGPASMATAARRMGALVLDWFIALGISWLAFDGDAIATLLVFAAMHVIGLTLLATTVGKAVCRIQVVRVGGRPAGLPRILLRTVLLCLVLPAVVVGPDGRGMHDKLADTVEIRM